MPAMVKPLMSRDEMALRWRLALAGYVKELRLNAGLTQEELAIRAGFNQKQMINGIERGRTGVPPERHDALAEALGVDKAEFAQTVLRYSNPWMYASLYGADDQLKTELGIAPDRVNKRRGPKVT